MKRTIKAFLLLFFFLISFKSVDALALGENTNTPYQFGQRAIVHDNGNYNGDYSLAITVLDRISGDKANQIVMSENMFNQPATSTKNWMLIKAKVEVLSGPQESIYLTDLGLFDFFYKDGSPVSVGSYDYAALGKNYQELTGNVMPGGYIEGWFAIRVNSGSDILLDHIYYDNKFNRVNTWFSTSRATGWIQSGGKWYYADQNGNPTVGWASLGGKWYNFDASGAMKTGWVNDGNKWYYMDSSGAMKTGWVLDGGLWYYMKADGTLTTGWAYLGGQWYYFNQGGNMATGWAKADGKWYFMDNNGLMKTGWLQLGNDWYYLYSDGHMACNEYVGSYRFGADGAWVK